MQKIGIIGGRAWGTALAQAAAEAGREPLIWAFEPETVDEIRRQHRNHVFLPDVDLHPAISATEDLTDLGRSDLILLVCPAQHVRRISQQLADTTYDGPLPPIAICAKGFERESSKLLTTVAAEVTPDTALAILSGPSFAADVARGLPTAVTLAADDTALGETIARALHHRTFRTYWSHDVVGAQIGGAVKNVLAIAAGAVVGKGLGASAHAALVTRGFAELCRLGHVLGARQETLNGLSGLGDLMLTCASPQSRNMSLGIALGRGEKLDDILANRCSVSEGVMTSAAVADLARSYGLEMPICSAVSEIVAGRLELDEAIDALMSRPLRAEADR